MPIRLLGKRPPNPTQLAKLVVGSHRYLTAKGREDGQHGDPHASHKGLYGVEIQINGKCEELLEKRREDYARASGMQEERIDRRLLIDESDSSMVVGSFPAGGHIQVRGGGDILMAPIG